MTHVPRKNIDGCREGCPGIEGAKPKKVLLTYWTHARSRNIEPGLIIFLTAFYRYLTSKYNVTFVSQSLPSFIKSVIMGDFVCLYVGD